MTINLTISNIAKGCARGLSKLVSKVSPITKSSNWFSPWRYRDHDVKPLAKALLAKFGSLRGILDAPLHELQTVKAAPIGMGTVTPVALHIIREAANLYLQQSAESDYSFAEPDALYRFWRAKIGGLPNEVFQVAYLDHGYRLLRDGIETLEEGTIDRAAVYPRRVMEAALRRNAAALVFAHNHPNGNIQPTEQDKF